MNRQHPAARNHVRPILRRHGILLVAIVAAVAIAAHLGVAGFAVAQWNTSPGRVGLIAGILTLKVLLITGYRAARARSK